MTNKELLSPCGLYCGVCGIYYADKKDDAALKIKFAAAYGDTPDKIACNGCLSSSPYWFCKSCPIKSCTSGKGIEGCHQCGEFPCSTIESFPIPEARKNMLRAIPRWRELGTEKWIMEEENLFTCKKCGSLNFRGGRKCRQCGEMMI
jgi:hypothetical protein